MTSLVEVIDAGRLRLRNFFSKMREHSIPSGLRYFDTFELDGQTERENEPTIDVISQGSNGAPQLTKPHLLLFKPEHINEYTD
jgi:hypothetical protein